MSALGHKQTCAAQKGVSALPPTTTEFPHKVMSALPPKEDISGRARHASRLALVLRPAITIERLAIADFMTDLPMRGAVRQWLFGFFPCEQLQDFPSFSTIIRML